MVQKNGKNSLKLVVKPKKFYVRTQDAPLVYELNASIYFWKRESCFKQKGPFCKKTLFYEMPYKRSIDIDSLSDFKLVEFLEKMKINFKNLFYLKHQKVYVVGVWFNWNSNCKSIRGVWCISHSI